MIRILTDSSSDLSPDEIRALDVRVVSQPTRFDGDTEELDVSADVSRFWKKLLAGQTPRTSQPSPEAFLREFEDARDKGDCVICILISSRLSGTAQCALLAKEMGDFEDVYIVDSLAAAASEKLLVMEACRLRDEGNSSAAEILSTLEALRSRIRLFATLDTLTYLARGGRIPSAAASLGSFVHLKAMITLTDGEVSLAGKALGRARSYEAMIQLLRAHPIDSRYPVIPIYACTPENCEAFLHHFRASDIACEAREPQPIGATIGAHAGPGAYGMAYVEK